MGYSPGTFSGRMTRSVNSNTGTELSAATATASILCAALLAKLICISMLVVSPTDANSAAYASTVGAKNAVSVNSSVPRNKVSTS